MNETSAEQANKTSYTQAALDTCPVDLFNVIFNIYYGSVNNLLGVLLNGMCIVVFASVLRHHAGVSQMFRYLFYKAVIDCLHFVVNSFSSIWFCVNCPIAKTFGMQVTRRLLHSNRKHVLCIKRQF